MLAVTGELLRVGVSDGGPLVRLLHWSTRHADRSVRLAGATCIAGLLTRRVLQGTLHSIRDHRL